MQEIYERVIVTNDLSCTRGNDEVAVIHACKSPCHQGAVGYRGKLPSTHPNYLVLEQEYDLFLNIIDPPVPLFMPPLFTEFLAFANKHWSQGRKLLIHCNQGESRAPSLAMLFLAKGVFAIPDTSYEVARSEFEKLYPRYNPGKGIETYFSKNWTQLGSNF
ncbi:MULTISPECIES: hypothetical protein [Pseudoalteromonas]|uniref:hypothetical protein n=1 Tax=Pseudoalteromonas TaxID=53246 RepID=UPI00158233BA|nr:MULTISPECIES: hypothetical protein [Pseudoalteromonas]MDI4653062.1 hypothetical protein [Pseudoalteromonas shioyasakiensis]NUJ39234.1 hypothetical protein [Pseudoalteromonas sp. 0303]